jgi:hypothetical protein
LIIAIWEKFTIPALRAVQLKPEAFYILERVLMQGEMPRGEVERITGLKERSARMVLSSLINDGILQSETPKGPVSLQRRLSFYFRGCLQRTKFGSR